MTIHGAKGLEFPVVFVPECDVIRRNTFSYVQWRRDEGISATLSVDMDEDTRRRRPGFYSYLARRDEAEEAAEYKRLFYVAATRAADKLYLSGAVANRGESWMAMARDALEDGAWTGVEVRDPVPVDMDGIAKRRKPPFVTPPSEAVEREVASPLVDRPTVVPMRSSTPVTALEVVERVFYSGPGLGLIRGSAGPRRHRALVRHRPASRPGRDGAPDGRCAVGGGRVSPVCRGERDAGLAGRHCPGGDSASSRH